MIVPIYATLMADATVAGIVAGRIYQDRANPNATAPYIVWRLLTATPENNLSHRPRADRESISVDVFARTERERQDLTVAARNALEPHGVVMTVQSLGQETDTGLWRMNFDIDWFYHR